MILESKGGQLSSFCIGLVLIGIGLACLVNIKEVYLNICLVKGSTFFYILNQTLTVLTLLGMAIGGFLMVRLAISSYKKCREFDGEPAKPHLSSKQLIRKILILFLILTIMLGLIILLNYFLRDFTVDKGINGKALGMIKNDIL